MDCHTPNSPLSNSNTTKVITPPQCVRNCTYTATTITTKNSPRSVVPSKVVEYISQNNYKIHNCNVTVPSSNTIAKVTLKHSPKPQSPHVVMADIPLRHSSCTRTLLPGLSRKSSILRATPRSRWHVVQEQILQHASFSFGSSSSASSSSAVPIIIKPPTHTQRILKYDPTTGNAYNNSNSSTSKKVSIGRGPHTYITISLLGMIPRSKLLLSMWKMTFLVSFLYINLHLFHLQLEHHHISELLSHMADINPYTQPTAHIPRNYHHYRRLHRHRSLRGSVTTSIEDYYSEHSDNLNLLLRGSKTSRDGTINEEDTQRNRNRPAGPIENVENLPYMVTLSPPAVAAADTSVMDSNDASPSDIPTITSNSLLLEAQISQEVDEDEGGGEEEEQKAEENEDSSNETNNILESNDSDNDDDAEETYILTNHDIVADHSAMQ